MTEDQLEVAILEKYVAQHKKAETATPKPTDECAWELDLRAVLQELTAAEEPDLSYAADLWLGRLAPPPESATKGPLRRCTDERRNADHHKYNVRAFQDPLCDPPAPAWDRIRALLAAAPVEEVAAVREVEQKFKILFSAPQEQRDFDTWRAVAGEQRASVGVLFIDIDNFKGLNTRHTETTVDKTVLPEVQGLLKRLTDHRGSAYRHGGEEFVVLLPNHDLDEAAAFAEKMRQAFETHVFQVEQVVEKVTLSIGVAIWPLHGETMSDVIAAANTAEHQAKQDGRNMVRLAGGAAAAAPVPPAPPPDPEIQPSQQPGQPTGPALDDLPRTRLTFVAMPTHSFWHMSRRGDRPCMQINSDWYVTNTATVPIKVLTARLLEPDPTGAFCEGTVSTMTRHDEGSTLRGHIGVDAVIDPNETLEIRVVFYLDPPAAQIGETLAVNFTVTDQYEHEHKAPATVLEYR